MAYFLMVAQFGVFCFCVHKAPPSNKEEKFICCLTVLLLQGCAFYWGLQQ